MTGWFALVLIVAVVVATAAIFAAGRKTGEVDPGYSNLSQITGAQQALLLGKKQEPISMVRLGRHDAGVCS